MSHALVQALYSYSTFQFAIFDPSVEFRQGRPTVFEMERLPALSILHHPSPKFGSAFCKVHGR